jgi:hypothetical protein
MGQYMNIEFFEDAVEGLELMGAITNRTPLEIVCDALETYEWILREQTAKRKIASVNGKPEDESELVDFVVNRELAEKFFSNK